MKRPLALAIALVAAATRLLSGQDAVERLVCVPPPVDLTTDALAGSAGLANAIADSLASELKLAGYPVLPNADVKAAYANASLVGSALLSGDPLPPAMSLGADVVVVSFYRIEGSSFQMGARAYDVISGRIAVSALGRGEAGVGVYDAIDEISANVAAKIRESLKPLSEAEIVIKQERVKVETVVVETGEEKGTFVEATFLSPNEGAELSAGDRALGIVEGGKVKARVKAGPLVIVTKSPGRYERAQTVLVEPGTAEYPLEGAYRISSYELSAALLPSHYLYGALIGFRWLFIPDLAYAGLTLGAGASPWDPDLFSPKNWGDPMLNLKANLYAGAYFFTAPDDPLRFALGLGVTVQSATLPGSSYAIVDVFPELQARIELNWPDSFAYALMHLGDPRLLQLWSTPGDSLPGVALELGWALKL